MFIIGKILRNFHIDCIYFAKGTIMQTIDKIFNNCNNSRE